MSLPDDPKDPINLENIDPEVVDTVVETSEVETSEVETPEVETPDAESPEASLPPSPSQKYSTKYFEPSNPPTESSEESTSEMETPEEVTEAPVLSEMNIEYQAPDAQAEAVEESVPEPVVPSNPFTKGTIEWIQEEEKLSQDRLIIIEEELAKSQRILKLDIAMAKVTKRGAKTKQEELDQYDNARDSLNSWVAERQGTYAWKLLEALRAERVKIDDLQKEIVDWTEKPTTEFYERTLSLKKAFIRRFRLGLIGIISSLLIGTVVGLILNALGLGLLVNLLAFLGFNNPFSWVPQVLGIGAGFSWIFALLGYFRGYYQWRKDLEREVAAARYYLKAVKRLAEQKPRILSLHNQMEEYLVLISEILHKPWKINEEWLTFDTADLDYSKLPTSLVVAKPKPTGVYSTVAKNCLQTFLSGDWRSQQVEALFKQFEIVNQMPEGSVGRLFDADPKMRAKVLATLPESQVLSLVGDSFVKKQAKYLQTSVLPEETGFYVDSIKPDPLAVLDFSENYFDEGGNDRDWNSFVGEILGEGAGWSGLAYSLMGNSKNLAKGSDTQSFALVPARLEKQVFAGIKAQVVPKNEATGVEVVIRIDLSGWLDPEMVNLLDDNSVGITAPRQHVAQAPVNPDVITG
jgi:hypothetical protein